MEWLSKDASSIGKIFLVKGLPDAIINISQSQRRETNHLKYL